MSDSPRTALTNSVPEGKDHREIDPATGQQLSYVILSDEERKKGFVRPLRFTYTHDKCGGATRISIEIAETYARDPGFYSGTFCLKCRGHFPLDQFKWIATTETVGS